MKRFSFLISLAIICSCVFSGSAFGEEIQKSNSDGIPDSIRNSAIYKTDPLSSLDSQETDQLKALHQEIINKGLISLNEDGQIVLNDETFDVLKVNSQLQDNYIENIGRINFLLEQGGVYLDNNFNLQMGSSEGISQSISERNLEAKQNQIVTPFSDPGAPPFLYAYSIATQNYNGMYDVWSSLALGIYGNPIAALSYTTTWWVERVKPGGIWDYKVVSGYSPYYKQWTAFVKGGGTQIRTTEWFGNYNYGFTGKLLFSLGILYTGGDVVSKITGGAPDDFQDRANIAQGYNENTF
ncbi:polymorphic toxin type 44 domain-containing protein [Paenibacillus sp. HW567]|uniref:polymorphic toxin type 44 domain-containing protein n=1 Tax=Paenibacillus sp. HW567 TaxID=1034769 RepID=UPI0003813D8A|nr:polymorphic toxin type 44 domain-containing protein [Paenibacillus sp. HW567]